LVTVHRNCYAVHSRLIGEMVEARVLPDTVEIWYADRKVEELPRLRGRGKHWIDYRHIIDWLVRKPGAFENYRYRSDLFPTSWFRLAYDALREEQGPKRGGPRVPDDSVVSCPPWRRPGRRSCSLFTWESASSQRGGNGSTNGRQYPCSADHHCG